MFLRKLLSIFLLNYRTHWLKLNYFFVCMSVSWVICSKKIFKFWCFNKFSRYINQNSWRSPCELISKIGWNEFQFRVCESVSWFLCSLRNKILNISLCFQDIFFKFSGHLLLSNGLVLSIVGITGLEMLIRTFFIWPSCRPLVLLFLLLLFLLIAKLKLSLRLSNLDWRMLASNCN